MTCAKEACSFSSVLVSKFGVCVANKLPLKVCTIPRMRSIPYLSIRCLYDGDNIPLVTNLFNDICFAYSGKIV